MESPLVNKAANYHTIEYQQPRNQELYMGHCGIQRCLPDYAYPRCARKAFICMWCFPAVGNIGSETNACRSAPDSCSC